jgi:hypothetical protein
MLSSFSKGKFSKNLFSAGGGGEPIPTPLGDATYWGVFATFADLDSIPSGDIREGDSASVTNVDGSGSEALMVRSEGWKIRSVVCDSFTTLGGISVPILQGANGFVASEDDTGTRYAYAGASWFRAPAGFNFQFPFLSSIGDLSTILDPLDGDTVIVIDTPFAFGKFRYNGTDWQLNIGVFTSFSQMTSYNSTPIETACLGFVEESGDTTENCVVYFFESGTWERSAALTSGYTWTSTNIADIDNPDPSGIGVTKPGDYLRLVLASGNRLFRLKRFTTAGGDVKNVDVWVPADWLESGTVKLWSYLVGNEANRIGSGFTDTIAGGGSPSITGNVSGSGYTRLQSGSGGSSAQLVSTGLALGVGQQIYMRAQMRGAASGANAACGPYSADGTNVSYAQMYSSSVFQFHTIAGGNLNSTTLRSGGSVLPNTSATGDFIEMLDEGRTVLASIYRSGALYHTAKRNQATLGSSVTAFAAASGGVLDVRYVVVITRTP